MSLDVSVLYKPCVAYLDNGSFYLLNLNALPKFFCCKQLNGKMFNYVNSICLTNVFIDEAKLFDQ